jgi:hypothetical protein
MNDNLLQITPHPTRKELSFVIILARISHTFSKQIAALLTEIAVQMGEDSVRATRPHPSEQQDRHAECASCQRKCEKSGLVSCHSFFLSVEAFLRKVSS